MRRRDVVRGVVALPLVGLPGVVASEKAPSVYVDGRFIPVLKASKDSLVIQLAKPLYGHTVFKADRPWDDKLDKVNLTPLGKTS